MKRLWIVAILGAIAWGIAAAPGFYAGESELLREAKRETALRVYTAQFPYSELLVKSFAQRYPFLQVENSTVPASGGPRPQDSYFSADLTKRADAFLFCQNPVRVSWMDTGRLARLDDLPAWKDHPALRGSDPYYIQANGAPHVIAYVKQRVSQAQAPRSYAELTGPRWKGKVALRSPLKGNSGAFLVEFVDAVLGGGLDWYAALARNGAYMAESQKDVGAALSSGRSDVGLYRDIEVFSADPKGEWLGFHFAEAGVPYQFQQGMINASAPHPAAARLFINWVMTEGQDVLEAAGYSVGKRRSSQRNAWFLNDRKAFKNHKNKLQAAVKKFRRAQTMRP